MPKFSIVKGSTSVILPVFVQDSSSSTGAGLGSLDQTSSIVGGYMKRDGLGIALAVDENVTTEGTYEAPTTAAQVRIGTPANMRTGTYELHFHNDLFTTADWVTITLGGATNMADLPIDVQLTDFDPNDGVRGALTALPNAAADGAGGLPISDAGGQDIDAMVTAIGTDGSNLVEAGGTGDQFTGLGGMSAGMKTEINDEIVDAINVDAYAEPAQGLPPATTSIVNKIGHLYKSWRNKKDNDGTTTNLYADDESTVDHKQTTSSALGTVTKSEWVTGP